MNHKTEQQHNHQFVFDGKLKALTGGLAVLGAFCLLLTFLLGGEHAHSLFWSNLLHNAVFFTGISFAALFFLCVHTIGWGGWHVVFKRIPEAMMMFLPVGAVLIAIVGVAVMLDFKGTDMLYMWSDTKLVEQDHLLQHKSPFLNPTVYLLTVLVVAIWAVFAFVMRKLSLSQDKDSALGEKNLYKMRFWSAIFLPIAGFSSAFAIWQWVMSVDAHWYSTLFAWYASVSLWVSGLSIILLIAAFLQSRGHLAHFTKEHMHDLGKYIFGFSVFWTYLWFSQFMLIWYANNGEETQYFFLRFEQFKPLFFGNLILNFLIPFFTLMMNSSKRTLGTVGFIAGLVVFGHWVDFFLMLKPGVWHNYEHTLHEQHDPHHNHLHYSIGESSHSPIGGLNPNNQSGQGKATLIYYTNPEPNDSTTTDSLNTAVDSLTTTSSPDTNKTQIASTNMSKTPHGDEEHEHAHQFIMGIHMPSILDVGTMLGFLGLFLFVTFSFLAKASLYPKNDPFLGESENHHT
jgi:hypothetical protein